MRFPIFLAGACSLLSASCTNTSSEVASRADASVCPEPSRDSPDVAWGIAVDTHPALGEPTANMKAAFTADGGLVLAGAFRESITLRDVKLESAGGTDLFVASFDRSGGLRFARRLGGKSDESFAGLAIGGGGGIYLAAAIKEPVDFGSGLLPIEPGSFESVVVVRIDSAGITHWGRSFSGGLVQVPLAVAADAEDNAYLAGAFEGAEFNLGAGPVEKEGTNFIVALRPDGFTRYSKIFEGNIEQRVVALAPGSAGDLAVGGWMKRLVVDGVEIRAAGQEGGYALHLSNDGALSWVRPIGSPELDGVSSLAIAPSGDVLVGGFNEGPLSLGPQMNVSATGYFLARFDRLTGQPKELRRVPFLPRIGTDARGWVYLAGYVDDAFDYGDLMPGMPGRNAVMLLKLDADAAMRRATALRGAAELDVSGFSVDKCGRMAVVGGFTQAVDLGAGRVLATLKSRSAAFVAVYPP